jgi:hypothetical protein
MTWYIDGSIDMGNLDVFATDKALGDYRVCMIDCDDETVSAPDLVANARLIAAAPRMRTALDSMVANYAQSGRVTDDFVRDVARMLLEIDQ